MTADNLREEIFSDISQGGLSNGRSFFQVNPVIDEAIEKALQAVTAKGDDDEDTLGKSPVDSLPF